MIACNLRLNVKSKTECPFLIYKLIANIEHLPPLSTINLPLVEFLHISTVSYHLPTSLVPFRHSLLDAYELVQVGLNCTMN